MDAVEARLAALEAESAVRRVMSDYMRLCDRLDADTPMDALGALFTADAEWVGAGARYGTSFGRYAGRTAIVAMLDRYRGPPPHFALNVHFLTSEAIHVAHNSAVGSWVMLQVSTFASGASHLTSARLSVRFRGEEGGWRIAYFQTENLFSRPIDRWEDATPLPVPGTLR
jgi:hypothetical protein